MRTAVRRRLVLLQMAEAGEMEARAGELQSKTSELRAALNDVRAPFLAAGRPGWLLEAAGRAGAAAWLPLLLRSS